MPVSPLRADPIGLPQSQIALTLVAKMAETREISIIAAADNVNPAKVG